MAKAPVYAFFLRPICMGSLSGVALLGLAACSGEPPMAPVNGQQATASGEVLFYSDRAGVNQIFSIGLDGSGSHPLTQGEGASYRPVWAPDGARLAFVTQYQKQNFLFVMAKADAPQDPAQALKQSLSRLLNPAASLQAFAAALPLQSPGQGDDPAWSSDGQLIAFDSQRDGIEQIYVCRADGSQTKRLTQTRVASRLPRWSPDGGQLLFVAARADGGQDIWTIGRDGGAPRNLTAGQPSAFYPRWSPDGRSVLFLAQENQHQSLYVMAADGRGRRRLGEQVDVLTPAWSPDGKQIAYVVPDPLPVGGDSAPARDPDQALMLINATGGASRTLSKASGNLRPLWSRDGKWIVFQSGRDGNSELYRIGVDGKGLSNLTPDSAANTPADIR